MNPIIESFLIAQIVWIIISNILSIVLNLFYECEFNFIWFDIWVGIYYNKEKKIIYINPFPTIVYSFDRNKRRKKKC